MPYEFMPVTLGIVLLALCLTYGLIRKHLNDRNRMRLREMAHQERIKAIEKEVPLMEVGDDPILPANGNGQVNVQALIWLRLLALCLGLAALFGGIGLIVAFVAAPDPEFHKIWPMGFIPAMIGFGLLLFYWLSRSTLTVAERGQPRD